MSNRHSTDDVDEQRHDYKTGEHFGLTPEEERRGTPLQQEIVGDVPQIAGEQNEPVPGGPVPGDPRRPDPTQPGAPDPLRPYPEPTRPDPTRPLPDEPAPPRPL